MASRTVSKKAYESAALEHGEEQGGVGVPGKMEYQGKWSTRESGAPGKVEHQGKWSTTESTTLSDCKVPT